MFTLVLIKKLLLISSCLVSFCPELLNIIALQKGDSVAEWLMLQTSTSTVTIRVLPDTMALSKDLPTIVTFDAKPYPFQFPIRNTALLVIDMQRDFVSPGGFGEIQGGDLRMVQESIAPTKALLEACRNAGLQIFHTREGQVPDLSDCPSSKLHRQAAAPGNKQHMQVIGDKGEMGRLLGKPLESPFLRYR
jgi:hypothetical protein